MYSNIFYNSNIQEWQTVDNFLLMGMLMVYYTIFLIFHACLKFYTEKQEDKAENCQLPITHLSGVNSFSDNAIKQPK